jgi:hypothetical protein
MNRRVYAIILAAAVLAGFASGAKAQPVPPCPQSDDAIVPSYGPLDAPPKFRIWRDVELSEQETCSALLHGRIGFVAALAGTFDGTMSLHDIAARIGALSASKGLLYWSTTESRWRTLISESFALVGPAARQRRPDFTPDEISSGRTLYFGQNDTRSTGLNVYALTATSVTPRRLVVEVVNVSAIRFALIDLFAPRALRSVHFIERLDSGVWGYYGLLAVKDGVPKRHEKSLVNRASAFYRFLRGLPGDIRPPLAR